MSGHQARDTFSLPGHLGPFRYRWRRDRSRRRLRQHRWGVSATGTARAVPSFRPLVLLSSSVPFTIGSDKCGHERVALDFSRERECAQGELSSPSLGRLQSMSQSSGRTRAFLCCGVRTRQATRHWQFALELFAKQKVVEVGKVSFTPGGCASELRQLTAATQSC